MIFLNTVIISIRLLLVLTLITGILYPIVITGFAERFFPFRSGGSRVVIQGKTLGSELIAQKFTKNKYFWPRPSVADYKTGASNASVTNASLRAKVEERKKSCLKNTRIKRRFLLIYCLRPVLGSILISVQIRLGFR
ncbi:K+-transporting ATPase, c chain domain protein [Leptospira interrogans serovar Bataviae str. HAI135]|nr:K+-transporting ATPase, c chain domain protein [Leptospira interrogans serovar Bataviae str. HAI135]